MISLRTQYIFKREREEKRGKGKKGRGEGGEKKERDI